MTHEDSRRQAALAEFVALRAEIVSRTNTQAALITVIVTAIGLVAGFVIKENGDIRLLLVLPFLVAVLLRREDAGWDRSIALIGSYDNAIGRRDRSEDVEPQSTWPAETYGDRPGGRPVRSVRFRDVDRPTV